MLFHNFLNYIDPGTGSMLFAIIIGVVTAGIFVVRGLFIKFKFFLQGGRGKQEDLNLPVLFSATARPIGTFLSQSAMNLNAEE